MSQSNWNSLYHQLRRAKKLDELMLFLEDPSVPNPGTYSRCAKAEPMLANWGFAHSPATIWRLYRRHVLSWRLGMAQSSVKCIHNPEDIDADNRWMTALRTSEFLAHPHLDPHVLVHLARIEHQKKVLQLHENKFRVQHQNHLDVAFEALFQEIGKCPEAHAALVALQETIRAHNLSD